MEKHFLEKVVLGVAACLTLIFAIFLSKYDWTYLVIGALSFLMVGILIKWSGNKNNAVKVLLITILMLLLLTWILPAAYYSGEYIDQGRTQMGLFDLVNYPITSFSYFGYIAFFIVLVGGFYGILYKIPAYRSFLNKIVEGFEGKEKLALSLMVIIISLLVSVCGLQFGIAVFVPFIVSIILLMGFDKMVAALVVAGSASVGLIGSTYAYNNLSILLENLSLANDYQIVIRFLILLVGIVLLLFNIFMYIKSKKSNKVEKKTVKTASVVEEKIVSNKKVNEDKKEVKKSTSNKSHNSSKNGKGNNSKKKSNNRSASRKNPNKAALKDEDIIVIKENMVEDKELIPNVTDGKHSIWPFVTLFVLLFIVLVLAFIPWNDNGFKISLFDDITDAVKEFEINKFPLFFKILGTNFNAFGSWSITDMILPLALVVCLLSFIYKLKFDDILDGFVKGAKKALAPAVVVILVYTVLVLVTYHPFQLVLYKLLLGLTKKFNIVTTAIVAVLASIFNADISYSFQSVVPYFTSVVKGLEDFSIAGIIFQSMYGFAMLFAPTSLVLMAVLSYLDVPYKEWLKTIWKLLLELFIILFIIFLILFAM